MEVIRTEQTDKSFYTLVGPFLGSRTVERETRDRFYDDPGKVWYICEQGVASVLNGVIRNFYAADFERAVALLEAITRDYASLTGIVPRTWREVFMAFHFQIRDYRTNFMEVRYEAH